MTTQPARPRVRREVRRDGSTGRKQPDVDAGEVELVESLHANDRPPNLHDASLLSARSRADATPFTGKLRSARISIIASPTAPVAPTTATFTCLIICLLPQMQPEPLRPSLSRSHDAQPLPRLPAGCRACAARGRARVAPRGRSEQRRRWRQSCSGTSFRPKGWSPTDWICRARRCPAPSRAPARTVRVRQTPSDADGSMPSEPVSIAATSDRMSPNMLPVTMTSNCFGRRTSCMPALSTYMCVSSTSG